MNSTTLGILAVLVCGPAPAFAAVRTVLGAEQISYGFATYRGDAEVVQTRVPLDCSSRLGAVEWTVGFDFASSRAEDWRGDGTLSGPAALRASLATELAGGRVALAGSADIALQDGPYDGEERLLLDWISRHELALPMPVAGQGHRFRVDASSLLLASRRVATFAGVFAEFAGAFTFRDDGLELDPTDLLGVGLGAEMNVGESIVRLQVFHEEPFGGAIDGESAYHLGARERLGLGAELPLAAGRVRASAELLSAGRGALESGWVLDPAGVRGGNRLLWSLGWGFTGPVSAGFDLDGTHHRGFSGALGRSDWIGPRLRFARELGGLGEAAVQIRYVRGTVREGRAFDGFGFGVTLAREWGR